MSPLDAAHAAKRNALRVAGVVLVVVGGLLTAAFSTEGYMILSPGQKAKQEFFDYHARELTIADKGKKLTSIPFHRLAPGKTFALPDATRRIDTTCANCPAIDHVYLYRSVEEIQAHVREAGLKIVAELALPVGSIPRERWSAERVEVNYAAVLEKQK